MIRRLSRARGGNRTRTILLSLDFESSASTNSATRADRGSKSKEIFKLIDHFRLVLLINF